MADIGAIYRQEIPRLGPGAVVALVNPPHTTGINRDALCWSIAKAPYAWHPLELLAQTGWLASVGLVPLVIDAPAYGLDAPSAQKAILAMNPSAIFALTAPPTHLADLEFLHGLGDLPVFVAGEQAGLRPDAFLESAPDITGVVIDAVTPSLANFLCGERDHQQLQGLAWRDGNSIIVKNPPRRGQFDLPTPLHERFDKNAYSMPGATPRPFATLITDVGCPWSCRVCNSFALGHRTRTIASITSDLARIKALGYRSVFVKAMSFGRPREHALSVCSALGASGLPWSAYVRPDEIDADFARVMAKSGCSMVRMGVESGDETLRSAYGKQFNNDVVVNSVDLCDQLGLRVGVHLTLGLPGETPDTIETTKKFIRKLPHDYVSVNILNQRIGSGIDMSDTAIDSDWLEKTRTRFLLSLAMNPRFVRRTIAKGAEGPLGDVADMALSGLRRMTGRWRT